jgi:Mg/Co/Ni transporter MgtE
MKRLLREVAIGILFAWMVVGFLGCVGVIFYWIATALPVWATAACLVTVAGALSGLMPTDRMLR